MAWDEEALLMLKEAITKLTSGESLGIEESKRVLREILAGAGDDAQIAALLVALKMNGETVEEVTGFAMGLREMAVSVRPRSSMLVDTCGTGGDGKGTFNISTTAALVTAGAGVPVAKHGNRAVSSSCGSADVLSALGVRVDAGSRAAEECIDVAGIGFLFAPAHHPAMKRVMGARRSLGIPTIFNILGPLANPAGARAQVIGVNRESLLKTVGESARILGVERAFVVHGSDGMDEFTLTRETAIFEVDGGSTREYTLSPEDLGLSRCRERDIVGGDVETNARISREVLAGKTGPRLDICLANAALALVASGMAENPVAGVEMARESVETGEAMRRLDMLVEISNNGGGGDVPG